MQADNYFQLPADFGNDKGMYQSPLSTGHQYSKWMKRNSGDATRGGHNFHLTGQTPQALIGMEGSLGYPYGTTGNFPISKHGANRLQNALNINRNRYFQHQFEMQESMSNRMLQGMHFNGMAGSSQQQQQYGVNRFYMNGSRRQSFKPPFTHNAHDGPHIPSNQYSFDSMLPNIPGQYLADDEDEEGGNYRHKYNKSKAGNDAVDLIGKYAKYYRAHSQVYQKEQTKAAAPPLNNKNNELVSRYLKHAAKKQVRSTSIAIPKYTGDYDPDVFVTGKLQSDENISQSSSMQGKQPSQDEINKESMLNKQEAAAEQKFRLEKANFPAPSSLSSGSAENKAENAMYKLKYTKRKKMVIASTSDKENDPSMLVKGGGDDVPVGNDDSIPEQTEKVNEVEHIEEGPIIAQEETTEQEASVKVPAAKKVVKKMRRLSVTSQKLSSEKETDKKVEVSNKQQPEQTHKPKVTKTVDIRKQVKKVTIEKVKKPLPMVATKNEEKPESKEEEQTTEDLKLQSIVEEEFPDVENKSCHSNGSSEEELRLATNNDEDNDEELEQQRADEELNAILAPLRAQMPDHFRISPTLGFLPIMPVTFSWFPMSQQHKEAFQKMSQQSKFPKSLRPFKRFAAT